MVALTVLTAILLQDRMSVPDATSQKEAEKLVRDVFKEEYAKKSPTDKVALARKLIQQGLETKDDPTSQFVLFREARDAALQAGDAELALLAISEIGRRFDADIAQMKEVVIATVSKTAKSPEELVSLVHLQLKVVEEFVLKEQYELADKGLDAAAAMARRAKDIALVTKAEFRRKAVGELKSRYEKVRKSRETLASSPQDAPASAVVGEYECLQKGHWEEGIRLLVQGDDAILKAAAAKDSAAASADGPEQTAAGDSWWEISEKQTARAKELARDRAVFWYAQALPKVSGLSKAKVEKRLAEATAAFLARGDWQDIEPKLFGAAGKAGDSIELAPKAGFSPKQTLSSPPNGDYDGITAHLRFDSSKPIRGWIIFEAQDQAVWVDAGKEHSVIGHRASKTVTTWNHDIEKPWPKKDEATFTVLVVGGELIFYLDNQEMGRFKTSGAHLSGVSLCASNGLVRFDRIRLRRVE